MESRWRGVGRALRGESDYRAEVTFSAYPVLIFASEIACYFPVLRFGDRCFDFGAELFLCVVFQRII